jgi:xanthine dehydrogenase accessory factor
MSVEVIRAAAESGAGIVLVTVIGTQGSVPRHSGSKMIVRGDRQIVGTVGGGRGEAMAVEAASRCLAERSSQTITVEMQGAEATGPNMVCGGTGTMLLEYIGDGQAYRTARGALEAGRRTVMVKKLEGMAGGAAGTVSVAVLEESGRPPEDLEHDPRSAALCMATGKPLFSEESGVFYDPVLPQEKLIILGGGHVGQALADMAAGLDFEVTVVDDRPEFAVPDRFHSPVRTICSGYAEAIASFPFDSATYAVIVTRGHLFDLECIRGVLARTYRYAGFIGSTRKARLLKAQAASDGFDQSRVAALRAPIGLDIAAETPAEIAVSILGEIVAVRRSAGAEAPGRT